MKNRYEVTGQVRVNLKQLNIKPTTAFEILTCLFRRVKGAYVIRWSRDGETLAIAVNQRQPSQTRILFIHPHSDSVISVGIGRLGSVTSSVLAKLAK